MCIIIILVLCIINMVPTTFAEPIGSIMYGNHAVMCFVYARLVSQTTGYYKTYLKIADGWSPAQNRYIDLSTAIGNNGFYCAAAF